MEIYVARQPIFDVERNVVGYELFYRSGKGNFYDGLNEDQATLEVLINSFMNIGIEKLTNGKPCFVNFTENLLKYEVPLQFPPAAIVVEILETISMSNWLLSVCRKLKSRGYTIALDDFVLDGSYLPLFPYIDLVKVDLSRVSIQDASSFMKISNRLGVKWLAEKVETYEQFWRAAEMGFVYFQGFFFSKPVIYRDKALPFSSYLSYWALLGRLNKDDPNIHKIAEMIERDLALTYRLLKLANSMIVSHRPKIKSIRHAIMVLGINELKKWISVLALRELYDLHVQDGQKHLYEEIVTLSFIRGKACELLGGLLGYEQDKASLFLMGICSLLDVLLHQPLSEILDELNIHDDIQACLLHRTGRFCAVYDLVWCMERGEWEQMARLCGRLGLMEDKVLSCYQEAIEWAVRVQGIL
ncbi:EAL and HDOD domain-containing protein [Geobacillus sp. JS12]|uniref:EAL and HDOD domain-containing protein n=1 Tax=Geobacillus sp. JS12 TaxID=1813182 RepID=UPI00078D4C4D|nr:HDOD domain-containing protein [Geobacillus sp. JS12]AMQ21767.1 hypothetical protein A0V43_13760 [Geobacillus sp. JS12]